MTDVKITQLPAATSSSGTDRYVLVQSGTTKQITYTNLFTNVTLVTPILGTPQSGTLTNCTGLPITTGVSGLGVDMATFLATPSSANLRNTVTDETGTGALVFATSPTFTTPILGNATATTINKVTFTAPLASAVVTIADGKTFTLNNSITFSGTDSTTMTFPNTSASIARTDAAQTFIGNQNFSNAVVLGVQSLSGAGAVDLITPTTAYTSTATGNALTLANGVDGQIKTVIYAAEAAGADTGILTPTSRVGYSTITFTNVGDSVTLQYLTVGWAVIGVRGATVA